MAKIEVVYAKPNKQWIIELDLELPITILQAIHQSKILEICPEINLNNNKTGIFGEILKGDHRVKNLDRVEIYRPLDIDPLTKRFEKVAQSRKNKRNKYHDK
jgi:putative ubiquitin-RnfH superfamily antitoxin RatB of RatAB toxin-antitoxin module